MCHRAFQRSHPRNIIIVVFAVVVIININIVVVFSGFGSLKVADVIIDVGAELINYKLNNDIDDNNT